MLPELSDTLLALTGISSATYVIMRTQENNPPIAEARQEATTADVGNKITLPNGVNVVENTSKQPATA